MITCDERDQETSDYKRFPKLIIEVLSESTEAFDRGDKFADYQTLESLEEYVLINTRHPRVECFRREKTDVGAGLWVLQSYTPETENFSLESVDFTDTLTALYEDVRFQTAEETDTASS
ncbi:MAG: Uma2 family endonuclease [Phormidesmis sp.]